MPALAVDLRRMGYLEAAELQKRTLEAVGSGEMRNTLFFVEHDPVLTLGANFHAQNLLRSEAEYREQGIEFYETERGGDVTYHGPGQLVIYPVFNVADFGKDLHKWLRNLEETIIQSLQHFGIEGYRSQVNTGVWVQEKKIAAIGVKVRKWVSMHGIALNCDNDLKPFGLIIPCGIHGYGVTSLTEQLGRRVRIDEAKPLLRRSFEKVFNIQLESLSREEFLRRLG
jgi:lipoyl(octanoyl) transferase